MKRLKILLIVASILGAGVSCGGGAVGTITASAEIAHEALVRALTRAVISECESVLAGGVAGNLRTEVDAELQRRGEVYRTSAPVCDPSAAP